MIIEMHSHTSEHSSCSHVKAVDLVYGAFERGLQGIVLTDHHYFWSKEELENVRLRSQVPKHFLLFSGQEVTTRDFGDVLVYGADRTIARGTSLDRIRHEFPEAALVWAHPYRSEKIPKREHLQDPRLDGIEIFNSNHSYLENYRGLQDWHRYRFTAVAGTDTHALSYTGAFPTLFDHPVLTVEELAFELRQGRCRPFFKEVPREGSNLQLTELEIGAEERHEEKIIIKELENQKWVAADRAFRLMQELNARGFGTGHFRAPRPLGRDSDRKIIIEEGIRGCTLFDKLLLADAEGARHCLKLTAQWLARLHNCRLRITGRDEFMEREPLQLQKYISAFSEIDHQFTRRAREIVETILEAETEIFLRHPGSLAQGHGDFNPKNIFIGHDNPHDPETIFVAAIDFDSSHVMLPAFDVGTFLAQFRNQFYPHPEVRQKVSESLFLESYLEAAEHPVGDFLSQVELFRARTNMSIAYYLIKVGLGESENLWRVLVESDQALTGLAFRSRR
jgi:3',5'-nucleoside bisphosphate phosphatase